MLLAIAGLLAVIYLDTGNLMTCVLLHLLTNEPLVVVRGPHLWMIALAATWLVMVATAARPARRWWAHRRRGCG
jgi:hypothetical protein